MPLRTPKGLARSAGRGSGRMRPMFEFSAVLFDSTEIQSYLDKRTRIAFESMGKALRRDMQRSLKLATRYSEISQIPKTDPYYKALRKRLRIKEYYWMKGEGPEPVLPFRASKPGRIPKIHSVSSPLKRGIEYAYEPGRRELVVGGVKMARTEGKVPNVLEYGGMSNGSKIAQRSYVRHSRDKMARNGRLAAIFAKRMKV